jgi:radical SAM superfamily enzyme YgiQ (UPF0313 family)
VAVEAPRLPEAEPTGLANPRLDGVTKMQDSPNDRRRILLVWPEIPPTTYWSFSKSLELIGKRASIPPLGLLTVAAMLPPEFELRMKDLNVTELRDEDLRWADAVFVSAMIVQADSFDRLVERANRLGVPVVAGGPHPSSQYEELPGVSHFVIDEAERSLSAFLRDWRAGRPRRAYARPADEAEARRLREHFGDDLDLEVQPDRATLADTPVPRFDLLELEAYRAMAIQFSRGCPVGCEFCDIWTRFGLLTRNKPQESIVAELDALKALGWKGSVFVVDDNFIGNTKRASEVLSAMAEWQEGNGRPFRFYTEATLILAERPNLLALMQRAGFDMVFVGIESPSQGSLDEAGKKVNRVARIREQVVRIQEHGIEVSSGFIVGFDNDPEDIAPRMIEFVQELGVPLAMVGLLTALPRTKLHRRLEEEGRLLDSCSGNNTHEFSLNFRPLIPEREVVGRYKAVLEALYPPSMKSFFERCATFRARWRPAPRQAGTGGWDDVRIALRAGRVLVRKRYGLRLLSFLVGTLVRRPRFFPEAVRLGILGYHLREITRGALDLDGFRGELASLREQFARVRDRELASVQRQLEELVGALGGARRATGEMAAQVPARVALLLAELERFRSQGLAVLSPALVARGRALRRYVARCQASLEREKRRLQSRARRRVRALSREHEATVRGMYDSFTEELDRMSRPFHGARTLSFLE